MTRGTTRPSSLCPADQGEFRGFPGFVEVEIESAAGVDLRGIIGRATWPVGVRAVAANQQGVTYPFGMLALTGPRARRSISRAPGTVNSAANVQSNSTGEGCGDGSNIGFSRSGAGVLNVTAPDAGLAGARGDPGPGQWAP